MVPSQNNFFCFFFEKCEIFNYVVYKTKWCQRKTYFLWTEFLCRINWKSEFLRAYYVTFNSNSNSSKTRWIIMFIFTSQIQFNTSFQSVNTPSNNKILVHLSKFDSSWGSIFILYTLRTVVCCIYNPQFYCSFLNKGILRKLEKLYTIPQMNSNVNCHLMWRSAPQRTE